jgi:hypothetical protein
MNKLVTEKRAMKLANILQSICMVMVTLALILTILILLGRINVSVATPDGYFQNTLLVEKDHNTSSRFMFTNLSYLDIHLNTISSGGTVGIVTYVGVVIMNLLVVLPGAYVFFVMASFFRKIAQKEVFTSSNASLLSRGGIVLLSFAFLTPLFNAYIIPSLIHSLSSNVVSTSVSINFIELFAGAILLVMAYVFHYGIYLQDEADHTL